MKNKRTIILAASCTFLLALGLTSAASAQMGPASNPGTMMGGLIGEHYSGVELTYIRRHENAPRVMQRYSIMARRALPDGKNLDGLFNFNHTRGSTLGTNGSQNDFTGGAAVFRRNGAVTTFFEGDLGWAWARGGGNRENSFVYQFRLGAEAMLSPMASVAPMVTYRATPGFHDHVWHFGVRGAFRLNPQWGSTITVQLDDKHNIETSFGILRRF